MLLGYARVSTQDQDTSAQIAALRTAGCELIFQEKASGGRWDRPELHRLLGQLRKGDVLVVWKLDRLSRSLKDVLSLMEKIAQYDQAGPGNSVVTDSFISLLDSGDTGLPRTITGSDQDIFLLDRQPVLKQARYKYLLVRFGPDKEIERVIVTNEIELP